MGIRLALGAETRDVFLLVVRDGMLLVGVGVVIGLGGGLLGARSLASFLYSVPTSDFPTFSAMTARVGRRRPGGLRDSGPTRHASPADCCPSLRVVGSDLNPDFTSVAK